MSQKIKQYFYFFRYVHQTGSVFLHVMFCHSHLINLPLALVTFSSQPWNQPQAFITISHFMLWKAQVILALDSSFAARFVNLSSHCRGCSWVIWEVKYLILCNWKNSLSIRSESSSWCGMVQSLLTTYTSPYHYPIDPGLHHHTQNIKVAANVQSKAFH